MEYKNQIDYLADNHILVYCPCPCCDGKLKDLFEKRKAEGQLLELLIIRR